MVRKTSEKRQGKKLITESDVQSMEKKNEEMKRGRRERKEGSSQDERQRKGLRMEKRRERKGKRKSKEQSKGDRKGERKGSTHLLFSTATPTVLRGVAMDATKLHCLA